MAIGKIESSTVDKDFAVETVVTVRCFNEVITYLCKDIKNLKIQINKMKVWMYITWVGIVCAGLVGVIW